MKFVCMGYIAEEKWSQLSQEEGQQMMEECFQYDDELRRGGHFAGGEALGSARDAVTLRMVNGKVQVTDGPYAETKEMLGGILLLEARDMEHAISLMSRHPGVATGPFELRPADEHVNQLIAARNEAVQQELSGHGSSPAPENPAEGEPGSEPGGTVRLHRVVRAPAERIYRAFLDANALVKWVPPCGFTGTVHSMNATVGSGCHMSFTNFGTSQSHSFRNTYTELTPYSLIRYTSRFDDPGLPGEMQVTVNLREVLCGTELNILQEGIPAVIPTEFCYAGWQESLMLLAHLVEPEIPAEQ